MASYLSAKARLEEFPARSLHTPVTEAFSLSGPLYVAPLHAAKPDVVSVPRTTKATGRLNQPLALAATLGSAAVTVGAVASYLSANERFAVFPAWSRHVAVIDAVAESGPP